MMMIFLWSWNFIETVCRILKRVEWQRVIFAIDHFRARDVFLHHSNPWRAHGRDNGLRGYAFSWMRWLSASLYPLSPISSKGKRVFAPSGGAQWQRNFPYFNSHFFASHFLLPQAAGRHLDRFFFYRSTLPIFFLTWRKNPFYTKEFSFNCTSCAVSELWGFPPNWFDVQRR